MCGLFFSGTAKDSEFFEGTKLFKWPAGTKLSIEVCGWIPRHAQTLECLAAPSKWRAGGKQVL